MPKKNGKSSKFWKRAKTVGQVAHKALGTALMVKKLLNVEYKHIDTAVVTSNPSTSGTVLAMNACAEGNGSGERNGLSIRIKSIFLRGYAVEHLSSSDTLLRIMIVKAKNPKGTTPTISDIFESTSPYLSLQNNVKTSEYTILWSKFIAMSSSGTSAYYLDKFLKTNFHAKYNSSAGTASAIEWNGVYLVLLSNQPTNTPGFTYTARIRYIDN